jgi:hypothetical protein
MGLFFSRQVAPSYRAALSDAYRSDRLEENEARVRADAVSGQLIYESALSTPLRNAYMRNALTDIDAEREADHVGRHLASAPGAGAVPTVQTFNWAPFWGSVVLLVLIFAAGIYTAHDDKMTDWSDPLLHTFQLLLGGWVGLIVGEKGS